MTTALAQIDVTDTTSPMDAPAQTSTTTSRTNSVPTTVQSSSTTVPPSTTSSTSSTTVTTSPPATTTTSQQVEGVDFPDWEYMCAFTETDGAEEARCVPFDQLATVLPTVPATDRLGCAALLDPDATYDPDLGADVSVVPMKPAGDGTGVYIATWYPDMAHPTDGIAVVEFTPADLGFPAGEGFPFGEYVCIVATADTVSAPFFQVRPDMVFQEWSRDDLLYVDLVDEQ